MLLLLACSLSAKSSPGTSPFGISRGLGSDDGGSATGSAEPSPFVDSRGLDTDAAQAGVPADPVAGAPADTPPTSTMSRTLEPEPVVSHGDIYMSSDDEADLAL